jgi:hypothetical protein
MAVEIKHLLVFRPFYIRKLSDKCLPIRTLLYISFNHILMSVTSFVSLSNGRRCGEQFCCDILKLARDSACRRMARPTSAPLSENHRAAECSALMKNDLKFRAKPIRPDRLVRVTKRRETELPVVFPRGVLPYIGHLTWNSSLMPMSLVVRRYRVLSGICFIL